MTNKNENMKTNKRTKIAQKIIVVSITLLLTLTLATTASAKEAADTDITSAINTEMWSDNAVIANNIDVTTTDGVVTLKGAVDNILAKDRVLALAEAIVGVRAIVNMVEVKPTTPRDDKELAKAVANAWFSDSAADSYELNAKADEGVVTITGTVQSYAEKELSEIVAKGVRGVKDVKNEIEVKYKTIRPDNQILNDIAGRLENDIRVDDQLIELKVNKGNVSLSGTVGSLQEKNQAGREAWVAGVKSVDTSSLVIKWWGSNYNDMKRTKSYVSRTDEEIKKAVKDSFFYDPRVLSFNPTVEVFYGTVTLSGMVDNLKAKRAAEQDAKNTLGILRVKNHLKVRPTIPTNEELNKRVATALFNNPYIERYKIDINAYNGWVYLSGDVNSSFEKNQAKYVTEGVKGVVGVVNNLGYEKLWVWKPDWEIRENVKQQLWWSPFVDEYDVNVSVSDGEVMLSGTVNSWSQKDDAEINAFQGGAKDVKNILVVDNLYYGPYGPGYYGSVYNHNPYYEPSK
jgi:osmotically-inducible protein OsmY